MLELYQHIPNNFSKPILTITCFINKRSPYDHKSHPKNLAGMFISIRRTIIARQRDLRARFMLVSLTVRTTKKSLLRVEYSRKGGRKHH